MSDVRLEWTKPMTSNQAAGYHMTAGFVAVELYNATVRELEAARRCKPDEYEMIRSSERAASERAAKAEARADEATAKAAGLEARCEEYQRSLVQVQADHCATLEANDELGKALVRERQARQQAEAQAAQLTKVLSWFIGYVNAGLRATDPYHDVVESWLKRADELTGYWAKQEAALTQPRAVTGDPLDPATALSGGKEQP